MPKIPWPTFQLDFKGHKGRPGKRGGSLPRGKASAQSFDPTSMGWEKTTLSIGTPVRKVEFYKNPGYKPPEGGMTRLAHASGLPSEKGIMTSGLEVSKKYNSMVWFTTRNSYFNYKNYHAGSVFLVNLPKDWRLHRDMRGIQFNKSVPLRYIEGLVRDYEGR